MDGTLYASQNASTQMVANDFNDALGQEPAGDLSNPDWSHPWLFVQEGHKATCHDGLVGGPGWVGVG
jgi:hypothetical protein